MDTLRSFQRKTLHSLFSKPATEQRKSALLFLASSENVHTSSFPSKTSLHLPQHYFLIPLVLHNSTHLHFQQFPVTALCCSSCTHHSILSSSLQMYPQLIKSRPLLARGNISLPSPSCSWQYISPLLSSPLLSSPLLSSSLFFIFSFIQF